MTMYERIIARQAAKVKAQWNMTPQENDQFFIEIAIEDIDNMANTDFLQLLSEDQQS